MSHIIGIRLPTEPAFSTGSSLQFLRSDISVVSISTCCLEIATIAPFNRDATSLEKEPQSSTLFYIREQGVHTYICIPINTSKEKVDMEIEHLKREAEKY